MEHLTSYFNPTNLTHFYLYLQLIKELILKDLIEIGKSMQLSSFEQVRDIRLYSEVFSIENGLLTSTLKIKRNACKNFFSQFIEDMYSNLD